MSANAQQTIGQAKTFAGAGVKTAQIAGLLEKGFEVGGGAAGGASSTVPYAAVLAMAAYLGTMFTGAMDNPDKNTSLRQSMRAGAAGAAFVPYGWIASLALGIASMFVSEDMPEPNKLMLSGSETMKWGDEGLSGFEGLLWDKNTGKQGWEWQNAVKAGDLIDRNLNTGAVADLGMYGDGSGPVKGTRESVLARSGMNPDSWYWGNDYAGMMSGDTADNRWMYNDGGTPWADVAQGFGTPVQTRETPIMSEKYGEINAVPDLRGAHWLDIQDFYGGQFADDVYQPFSEGINKTTSTVIDLFNNDIQGYLATLPEAERAVMTQKLQNTDFTIAYNNAESGALTSGYFTKENPGAYGEYMVDISKNVSNQLMEQAMKAGVPGSAFGLADDGTPTSVEETATGTEAQPTNEGTDMGSSTEGQYLYGYAMQQEGWDKDWNKYQDTLLQKLKDPSLDYSNPGKGLTAIPQSEVDAISKFASTLSPMSSDKWTSGSSGSRGVSEYIDGYDWDDYWNRLEERGKGQAELFGNIAGRFENLGGDIDSAYLIATNIRNQNRSSALSDQSAARARVEELDALPGLSVTGPGGSSFSMSQREGSKKKAADNLFNYSNLLANMVNSRTQGDDIYAGRTRENIGDVGSAYNAMLNAPVTSYQEFAPHMTRWDEYAEAARDRDFRANQGALDRASRMDVAKLMQQGKEMTVADWATAFGTSIGTVAKVLGIKTGDDSTVGSTIVKGGTAAFKTLAGLFSGGDAVDYTAVDDPYGDFDFSEVPGYVDYVDDPYGDFDFSGIDWNAVDYNFGDVGDIGYLTDI